LATYTGAGTLLKGMATVSAATTWNVAVVDLDDGTTTLDASLTINANAIDVDGDGVDVGGPIFISDDAALTVNIAGGGSWAVDPGGNLIYNGDAAPNSYLAGSDIAMNGTINHFGDGRTDARLDIGATGVININTPGQAFRLSGGNVLQPNTIAGGTINGPGILGTDIAGDSSLHGFGTINASIDFDGGANLRADNGMLTLNGAILDAHQIGTNDNDGILNVTVPWNTNTVDAVVLNGGELRGAVITNDAPVGGITGHGLVAAQVINNSSISAEGSGLLVVQSPLNINDWDGNAGTGSLGAGGGDLEVRDNAPFAFSGTVTAFPGKFVFANGFALEFQPGSSLRLQGGTYRSTHPTHIGGTVEVLAGGPSALRIQGNTIFENGSSTMLNADLLLDNSLTTVEVGADFAGGASLINSDGRTLRLLDGVVSADLAVEVKNQGTLDLGAATTAGQVTALGYQQDATGVLQIELGGAGLDDFDRMNLTGVAGLNGTLSLSLIGGFDATIALGSTFNVLSAAGGVGGTFASVIQPATMPAGLLFDVIYDPTQVQLLVVAQLLGDYNRNGVVDASDYVVWRDTLGQLGAGLAADGDSDGTIDQDDYDVWRAHFGQTASSGASASASASAAIPEPGTLVLLLLGALAMCIGRRATVS
jgi:hypothetical protein